jgi:hypothetical protein
MVRTIQSLPAAINKLRAWVAAAKANLNGDSTQDFFGKRVTAGSGNYVFMEGGAGVAPSVVTGGADNNVGLYFGTKGTGEFNFSDGAGRQQFRVGANPNAVNYTRVVGGSAGANPTIMTQGTDANIGFDFTCKGAGEVYWRSNGGTQFVISNTLNPVNYLHVSGAAAGATPTLQSTGTDTNVNFILRTKGFGWLALAPGGGWALQAAWVASAVNYVRVMGAAAGSGVVVGAEGADTNIDINVTPKGTGAVKLGGDLDGGAKEYKNLSAKVQVITGTSSVNISNGPVVLVDTPTAATAITFTGLPAPGQVMHWEVEIVSPGANAVTFTNPIVWDGGSAPTIQTGTKTTILAFRARNKAGTIKIIGAASFGDIV